MPVTVAFLGDTLLGDLSEPILRERGYASAFGGIASLLARADLVVANLEGVLTDEADGLPPTPHRERYWLRAERVTARAMAEAGITLVSLANNHVLDYGLAGLRSTMRSLDEHGIQHLGAGMSEQAARRSVVVSVKGLRLGFYAAVQRYDVYADWLYATGETGGCNRLREQAARGDLASLAEQADVRIALAHWGRTYRPVTPGQERWAGWLTRARADLVVGHHPHIAQPAALVNERLVLYSLGNGPFGTKGGFERFNLDGYGLLALAEFAESGPLSALELHAIDVDNARTECRPVPLTGETARSALASLASVADGWRPHGDAMRLDLTLRATRP